jgi:hypothetical protein
MRRPTIHVPVRIGALGGFEQRPSIAPPFPPLLQSSAFGNLVAVATPTVRINGHALPCTAFRDRMR